MIIYNTYEYYYCLILLENRAGNFRRGIAGNSRDCYGRIQGKTGYALTEEPMGARACKTEHHSSDLTDGTGAHMGIPDVVNENGAVETENRQISEMIFSHMNTSGYFIH